MKKFFCNPKKLILFFLLVSGCVVTHPVGEVRPSSYAVYYGNDPVYQRLDRYDWVIVPDSFTPERHSQTRYFAYLTIGEVDRGGEIEKELMKRLGQKGYQEIILSRNDAWHSWVLDIRNEVVQKILLKRVSQDVRKGFRGLFLDTADSPLEYQRTHPKKGKGLDLALISFIRKVHQRYPSMGLILNRGFPILPSVGNVLSGVMFEDFCSMYDDRLHRYTRVSLIDRRQGLVWIERSREVNPHLVVLTLDYGNPRDKRLRRTCRRQAHDSGFIPFFSDRSLDEIP